jgi:hypothetical protein
MTDMATQIMSDEELDKLQAPKAPPPTALRPAPPSPPTSKAYLVDLVALHLSSTR